MTHKVIFPCGNIPDFCEYLEKQLGYNYSVVEKSDDYPVICVLPTDDIPDSVYELNCKYPKGVLYLLHMMKIIKLYLKIL